MASDYEALDCASAGTTVSVTGAASAGAALPVGADGNPPKSVRVIVLSGVGYIKFGKDASVAATNQDIGMQTSWREVFRVRGKGFFSVIPDSGTVKVNIVPVENG